MKKTTLKTRLWALAATLLLLVSLLAMPVSAANTNVAPTTNLQTTFNKYLVMDANANVPNAEFEFKIGAGTAVPATDDSPAIYAGIVQQEGDAITAPTVEKATFSYNTHHESTTVGLPTDDGTATENKKYATDEVTVNFSGIEFTAPGIYRYTITEVTPTQSGIAIEGTEPRTLDVYVQYKNTASEGEPPVYSESELEVSGYVLYNGTENISDANKSDGFTNTYTTYDLTLTKKVTGNQGDRDKYFAFTVNITGAVAGTVYTVDLPETDNHEDNSTDPLTVGVGGSVSATYYLKHGQSIVIQGLTADTHYTITEDDYSSDGYSTAYSVEVGGEKVVQSTTSNSTGDRKMSIDKPDGTAITDDNVVTFTNSKSGTVPTGILLETAPYLILGAVVVAGLVVLFATRRRRTRE